jgi:hypothetical protein
MFETKVVALNVKMLTMTARSFSKLLYQLAASVHLSSLDSRQAY